MNIEQAKFEVITEQFGAEKRYKLCDWEQETFVTILPFLGGAINSFVIQKCHKNIALIDGYQSDSEAKKEVGSSFKGSCLFPFANRIEDGQYYFNGQDHQLPINAVEENNSIHGLVYDKNFTVGKRISGDDYALLKLRYQTKGQAGYPFAHQIEITYRLEAGNNFSCTTKIINDDQQEIPISQGWHPYFQFPNVSIDQVELQCSAKTILELDSRNLPTGKTSNYSSFNNPKKIGATEFDSCFYLGAEEKIVTTTLNDQVNGIKVELWQKMGEKKYNYLQIYTPPHRNSIAIEPMTSAANSFNSKIDLITLKPQTSISFKWGFSVTSDKTI